MKSIVAAFGIVFGMAGIVVLAAPISIPVMLLWDWLMPNLFGLPKITWLQAWGLSTLCSFLFKSSSMLEVEVINHKKRKVI